MIASTGKNGVFAGSDGGGEHRSVIASLIETCKLIGVQAHDAYLADVITRTINHHPNSQSEELRPLAYLATRERWPGT